MIDQTYCSVMAAYNAWMNKRVFALCAEIPENELRKDCGAFFGSIYLTLNHIMYGDLAFMSRFTGEPDKVPELGVELFQDYAMLHGERLKMDQRIISWAGAIDDAWLVESITYVSKVDGVSRTLPNWVLATHMFNHQTHHRGQVTTLLSQLGEDVGSTDIPFLEDIQSLV